MSKKPKIEFYEIHLKPTKADGNITFRDLFTEIYNNKNPESKKKLLSDKLLMQTFLAQILNRTKDKFKDNNQKKKAFYVKTNKSGLNDSLKFGTQNDIIHGLIKGGPYDTGKEEADINNPEGENKKFKRTTILLDDFYFLLYTPLDKNIGVLILQNYTSDQIADIFVPFVKSLFKVEKYSYKAIVKEFMPKEMQDDFKQTSSIKKFVFSNQYLVSDMDKGTKSSGKFTVQISISASDADVNTNNLSFWKSVFRKVSIKVPGNENRVVESFAKQNAYIKDNTSVSNPTVFSLDDELLKIKATIYLQNHIGLEENRTPKWKELERFAQKTLKESVIPELYPESDLDEE